jgi:hypothetical protein
MNNKRKMKKKNKVEMDSDSRYPCPRSLDFQKKKNK